MIDTDLQREVYFTQIIHFFRDSFNFRHVNQCINAGPAPEKLKKKNKKQGLLSIKQGLKKDIFPA